MKSNSEQFNTVLQPNFCSGQFERITILWARHKEKYMTIGSMDSSRAGQFEKSIQILRTLYNDILIKIQNYGQIDHLAKLNLYNYMH